MVSLLFWRITQHGKGVPFCFARADPDWNTSRRPISSPRVRQAYQFSKHPCQSSRGFSHPSSKQHSSTQPTPDLGPPLGEQQVLHAGLPHHIPHTIVPDIFLMWRYHSDRNKGSSCPTPGAEAPVSHMSNFVSRVGFTQPQPVDKPTRRWPHIFHAYYGIWFNLVTPEHAKKLCWFIEDLVNLSTCIVLSGPHYHPSVAQRRFRYSDTFFPKFLFRL